MSSADCNRWIKLTDQAAVGEVLSDKDQVWLSQHASVCQDCGSEERFYASFHDALGRPEMLLVPSQTPTPARRRLSVRRPLLLGLALAAGLALVVGGPRLIHRSRPTTFVPAPDVTAQVRFASGDARLGLSPAQAGQSIPRGEHLSTSQGLACMGLTGSIEVCLDAASVASFALGDPDQILVTLEKGTLMARLDHQPAGRKFLVRTAGAEVQAVGTRFSVRLESDGRTRVRLHEGKLAVRAASRVTTDLAAPVQADIAEDIRVAPLSPSEIGEDKLLADLVSVIRSDQGAPVFLASTPTGADVLLDDMPIGRTPVSMFLSKAVHVRVSTARHQPVSDWIEVRGQTRIERAFALAALPETPAQVVESPSPRPARVSPGQLLAKAQSLRSRGQYQACARIYHRLWSEFPGSEEAKVSMVSLGELELVQRKNPGAALTAFNAYLRLGGALDREARFGKIRALRALDRREAVDVETARFLSDYPTSTQAATLRQRAEGK
jgi:ferric-dicitrate binding protein FerR (iron transport regulator)